MLYVERSNRTESLLAGLCARLTCPRADPLAPAIVVVQGQGMERWIAQSIARERGVCANAEFLFPRKLIEQVFDLAENPEGRSRAGRTNPTHWEIERLVWAVARRIAQEGKAPELAPLARQLESSDRGWRLVQLAQQIAGRFDDYITYRPDWVARWATSDAREPSASPDPDEAWQAWLFRGLLEDLGPGHFADRAARFLERVRSESPDAPDVSASSDASEAPGSLARVLQRAFPVGVEVFAVSTLPPLHLSVLDGLARLIDVRLSVLSPSRHYWADLWGEIRESDAAAPSAEARRFANRSANSVPALLAGLGRLGGDFQSALEQRLENVGGDADRFEDPNRGAAGREASLLQRVQQRMLDLDFDLDADLDRDSETPGEPGPSQLELLPAPTDRVVRRSDRSLQIHLCHGPKRELEIVLAALRAAFAGDPSLTPEDVIVMAPRIDALVPAIDAVFGGSAGDDENPAIPYRIADRSTLQRSPVAEAFVGLLGLLTGRGGRSEVFDWLGLEPVRERLGVDADGIERLADWAARAGIRFGFDADHREALGLEASRGHSWAGGLDRLVLGHALGATAEVVAELIPEPLDAFSDPAQLGALGELQSTLARARRDLARPRSVTGWSDWLSALLEATLAHRDDNAHEHGMLRSLLQRLSTAAEAVGFDAAIPFEAMRERFMRALESSPPAQGFLAGGVTFCELVPLRAIPFRIIAIVGLSDTSFPRRQPAPSYDLIARHPRSGDRNPRSDDRYLFLEALLSCRDQLILSVPSRDLRDGSDLPPSVVISELLDVLDASFELEAGGPAARLREHLVVEHPIHAFSPRYFEAEGDARLLGLDAEAYEGALTRRAALASGGGRERRFLDAVEVLSPRNAATEMPRLSLDELTERVLHSTRYFARNRLGLRLPHPERVVGDFDPEALEPFDRFGLGAAFLADRRAGTDEFEAWRRLRANARLPEGEPGRLAAEALRQEVELVFAIARSRFAETSLAEHPFELVLDPVATLGTAQLFGRIRELGPEGPLRVDFSRLGGRRELEFWIQHLVVCALAEDGAEVGCRSVLVSRFDSAEKKSRVAVFSRVEDAKSELAALFEWAWSVDRAPLPFFPRTSRVFAEAVARNKGDAAWNNAHQQFYGGDWKFGGPHAEFEESLEYARIWEGRHPLESDASDASEPGLFRFDALAERFFAAHRAAREVFER